MVLSRFEKARSKTRNKIAIATLAFVWMEIFFLTSEGRAELPSRKVLTLDAARQFAASAEKHARENQWNVCIAIVDDGGHLICFQRMDETQYGSIVVAQQDGAIAQAGADALPNAAGR